MSGGTYKRGERVSVGYKHTDASNRDLSERNHNDFSRPAFAMVLDEKNASAENSSEKGYSALVPTDVYDTIKKCAEDYDIEKGCSVVRKAIETHGENERLLYWAFVFYVCDKFDIDSNKTRTDIVDNARRMIDNAFLPMSDKAEAFISKLSEKTYDLRSLRVERSLLPCPDDVKEKYDELADTRDKTVALTDNQLDDEEEKCASHSRSGFLSLMLIEESQKRNEILSYRKRTLSDLYREMNDVNKQIDGYIDYVNYNRDSVRRMIRNIKSESIDEIREIYTPQYIYSNYGGDGVTARVREILTEPTVAECAVFEYFSPCSPSIFESSPFVRLRETTTSFGLARELTNLETVAREEYERISAEIEREFAEDYSNIVPQRFCDELDERLEMLTDRQKSVKDAVAQAKSNVSSTVTNTVIMILAMTGLIVGAYFAYVNAHKFLFGILVIGSLLLAGCMLFFISRQIRRAGRRNNDPGFSRANMFRELTDIKKLQRIYFEVGAEYLSARESLRDSFPQLMETDKKSADAT